MYRDNRGEEPGVVVESSPYEGLGKEGEAIEKTLGRLGNEAPGLANKIRSMDSEQIARLSRDVINWGGNHWMNFLKETPEDQQSIESAFDIWLSTDPQDKENYEIVRKNLIKELSQ